MPTKPNTIAFDCDGTLMDYRDNPRKDVIDVANLYRKAGWRVIVWSGGGEGYARSVARRCGLEDIEVMAKSTALRPDIAVDDMDVNLGIRNIKVNQNVQEIRKDT